MLMKEEMTALHDNNTWDLGPRPKKIKCGFLKTDLLN